MTLFKSSVLNRLLHPPQFLVWQPCVYQIIHVFKTVFVEDYSSLDAPNYRRIFARAPHLALEPERLRSHSDLDLGPQYPQHPLPSNLPPLATAGVANRGQIPQQPAPLSHLVRWALCEMTRP